MNKKIKILKRLIFFITIYGGSATIMSLLSIMFYSALSK